MEIKMTNIQKALELISTFASGDTEKAKNLLAEGYIQHNPAYGTGRDAFVGSVEYLASAPVKTPVNNIRAFEDGDRVFLQTVYNFAGAGEQVAFDIFRFDENGLIAEHWDNLAAKAAPNPSGRTQIDGTMELKDLDKTEENRRLVENFLIDVMQNRHPEKTAGYFDGDTYIQHNTGIADDERYRYMFSVEEVNRLTQSGIPFRDAYKKVGLEIESGQFEPVKSVRHTHEGSIGNLCNDRIAALFDRTMSEFHFDDYHRAIDQLLQTNQ